eukprot:gene537-676_t
MSTTYNTIKIDNYDIFYRESGKIGNPTLLLLHGFPSSSHQYRHLLSNKKLNEKYHLIAPDYIGYDNLAKLIEKFIDSLNLTKYSLYVFDYGAQIGYRVAISRPEQIQSFIVQNGNAYDEGLECPFWDKIKKFWAEPTNQDNINFILSLVTLKTTQWQYLNGTKDNSLISPDGYISDQFYLDRTGNAEIQGQLIFDYGSNPAKYPLFQEYFRKYQPPMLIVWGKNDEIFPPIGAHPYKRDIKNLEFHLLETGHFALEDHHVEISNLIDNFLSKNVK